MTEKASSAPAPLLIDVADLADRMERIERARERWRALDAMELQAGRLSVEDERARRDADLIYSLDGKAVLNELCARARLARRVDA